jgi:hypothetical protein
MSPSQLQDTETVSTTKPVMTFRLRGISASIFTNKGKSEERDITFHKVSVQRSYKVGNEWKQTTSFGRDDLPILNMLLQRAWEFILDAEATRGKEEVAA